MALGSTQPLAKMSTRDVPGGKGDLPPYSADVKKSRNLNSSRPLWACMACNGCALRLFRSAYAYNVFMVHLQALLVYGTMCVKLKDDQCRTNWEDVKRDGHYLMFWIR
jgi:hypothetical protein